MREEREEEAETETKRQRGRHRGNSEGTGLDDMRRSARLLCHVGLAAITTQGHVAGASHSEGFEYVCTRGRHNVRLVHGVVTLRGGQAAPPYAGYVVTVQVAVFVHTDAASQIQGTSWKLGYAVVAQFTGDTSADTPTTPCAGNKSGESGEDGERREPPGVKHRNKVRCNATCMRACAIRAPVVTL